MGTQKVHGVRQLPRVDAESLTVRGEDVVRFLQEAPSAAHLRAAGIAPFVVFDADGTLWNADLPGQFFEEAAARGMLSKESRPFLSEALRRLGLEPDESGPDLGVNKDALRYRTAQWSSLKDLPPEEYSIAYDEGAKSQMNLMKGMNPTDVEALAAEMVQSHVDPQLFREVDGILNAARAKGLTPLLVTAGPQSVAGRVVRDLGFKGHEIYGLRPGLDPSTGRYDGTLQGILTSGAGKEVAARQMMGALGSKPDQLRRPLLTFGDSADHGDRWLHAMAFAGLVVEPNSKQAQAAVDLAREGKNVRILDMQGTRSGASSHKFSPGQEG